MSETDNDSQEAQARQKNHCITILAITTLLLVILVCALSYLAYTNYGNREVTVGIESPFGSFSQARVNEIANRVLCGVNLAALRDAIQDYSNDYGKYPIANTWCELLIEYADVTKTTFVCKSARKGRCHYAINPNAAPNSPGDMVLLFEGNPGWNQFGGAELLAPENHNGEGCNILFNDGHVEFVKTEDLGKLKWK